MAKKLLILGVIFVLAVTIFTGCTKNELGFYELNKEFGQITAYEATEKVTLEIALPDSALEDAASKVAASMLKNIVLEIDYKADNQKMEMEMDITMTTPLDNFQLGKVIMKDAIIYLPVSGVKEIMQKYADAKDIEAFNNAIGEAQYITIDFVKDMGMKGMDGFLNNFQSMSSEILLAMDKIINQGYKDFSLGDGVITQTLKGYKFTLKDEEIAPVCLSLAKYTINNSEQIRQGVMDLYKTQYMKDYIALMNMPGITHEEMIAGLEMAFDHLAEPDKKQMVLTTINSFEEQIPQFTEMIKGSYLEYSLGKEANGDYVSDLDMLVNVVMGEAVSIKIKDTTTIKPVASVNISAPVGKTVTLTEVMPPKTTMTLFLTEGEYFTVGGNAFAPKVEFGATQSIIEGGHTYLPLRQVGEIFGENIKWDNTKKAAFIITPEGKEIGFTGIIKDGGVFVKMRDFEPLGYSLDWNAEDKIVTINK